MINTLNLTSNYKKQVVKVPKPIQEKAAAWMVSVETIGLAETGKIRGYNVEHLSGKLSGLRSVRMNKAYRLYFKVVKGHVQVVDVLGIDKHKY